MIGWTSPDSRKVTGPTGWQRI